MSESEDTKKENERRVAMGLPPVRRERKAITEYSEEEINQYLSEVRASGKRLYSEEKDVDAFVERVKKKLYAGIEESNKRSKKKKSPKKKSKLERSDSVIVIEDSGEISAVSVGDSDAAKPDEGIKANIKDRLAAPSSERSFKDRFSSIFKLTKLFESKQSDAKKEKLVQSEEFRKQVEKTEQISVALEALSKEHDMTVKLLKELLDTVKGNTRSSGEGGGRGRSRGGLLSSVRDPNSIVGMIARGSAFALAAGALTAMQGGTQTFVNNVENAQQNTESAGQTPVETGPGGGPAAQEQAQRGEFNENLRSLVRSGQIDRNQANDVARRVFSGDITYDEGQSELNGIIEHNRNNRPEESQDQIYQRLLSETPEVLRDNPNVQNSQREQAAEIYQQNRQRREAREAAPAPTATPATPAPAATPATPTTPAPAATLAPAATPATPTTPAPAATPATLAPAATSATPATLAPAATPTTPATPAPAATPTTPATPAPAATSDLLTPLSSTSVDDSTQQDAVEVESREDVSPSMNMLPKKNEEAIISDAVRKQEILSAEYENRPDMFSNRNLMIRARSVKFKGDEIEFQQPDSLVGKSDAQRLTGVTPSGISGAGAPGGTNTTTTPPPPAGKVDSGSGDLMRPTGGKITSGFGQRAMGDHKGIDFGLPIGSPIISAQSGTVVEARTSTSYGNMIKIRGDNGLDTLYAHLSSIGVQVGQQVEKGQQIGLSGNTGRSTGPHLHFEAIKDGTKIDPAPLMNASGDVPSNKQDATPESIQDAPAAGQASSGDVASSASPASAESGGGGGSSAPAATPEPAAPSSGMEVAQASMNNEVAARTPEPPSVTQIQNEAGGGSNPSSPTPTYSQSVNDPGNVEPADAAERYARLFNMAA